MLIASAGWSMASTGRSRGRLPEGRCGSWAPRWGRRHQDPAALKDRRHPVFHLAALLLAVDANHVEIAKALLDAGASVNAQAENLDTPWLLAGARGRTEKLGTSALAASICW